MNKTLLMLAGLAITAGLVSASPILVQPCAVLMFPNTTGNTGSTCSATADAGDYLTSVTITVTDDYTGWQTGNPVVSYSGNLTESSPLFSGITFCNVTTTLSGSPTVGNSNPCGATVLPSATVTNTNTSITAFSFNITNGDNSVTGGTVTGASEVFTIAATEAPIPTTGTPEPTTFGLVGGALLGLGLLRKKVVRS